MGFPGTIPAVTTPFFIPVLTGMFTLFGFAWGAGGPASIWAWVLALGGQLLFAFVFAELAVRYPLQGSVYNWTKNVAPNKAVSWMAGASMTLTGSDSGSGSASLPSTRWTQHHRPPTTARGPRRSKRSANGRGIDRPGAPEYRPEDGVLPFQGEAGGDGAGVDREG